MSESTTCHMKVACITKQDEKLIWALHRAMQGVDIRWGGSSVRDVAEELERTELDHNERFLLLRAWQVLAVEQSPFFRLWSGYEAMYRSLCDQSLDVLEIRPELKQAQQDADLLAVYEEAYLEATTQVCRKGLHSSINLTGAEQFQSY